MINYINNIYHTILNMNVDEIINKNKLLEEELQKTKDELIQTKEHLKQYTAPISRKIYYEKNKEKEKQRAKEYKEKTNYSANLSNEKKKEYAHRAYLNKKEKLKKLEEKNEKENI
jgi:hypothetical protein